MFALFRIHVMCVYNFENKIRTCLNAALLCRNQNVCMCVFERESKKKKKRAREILLTLVFSCLVTDLHGPLVVTLRAMQHTHKHIQRKKRKTARKDLHLMLII